MAKINHHNFVDTINDVLNEAKKRGVMRLEYNDDNWEGSHMRVQDRTMVNFGTCGYMGLESHPKIIDKTIEFTRNYGTQFSVSRTYLTDKKSHYLEDLLAEVFNKHPVITFTSTTIAHMSVLPIVVRHNDVIILDQQAHISIQTAAQLMLPKGVKIEVIRHSNLEMLEHKIKQLRDKHEKIWYMIDGVYSMYGDIAPIDEINELMTRYPQLHLYVDDAHGMSWYGKNGCGRIFKEASENKRTIYVTTMAKGFGAMGGIAVFPDRKWYEQVISHGGPLSYSHPLPPPMLGAAIGSAEIHLTGEIETIQDSLREKLEFTSELLNQTQLPVISHPGTPIFYVGTGQPNVGYNFNKRILDSGFYVTLGIFPGVPVKNTGLRFTVTNHNSMDQIESFVEALNYHYPQSLEEEGKSFNDVRKAFKLPLIEEVNEKESIEDLIVETFDSILQIDRSVWDECYLDKGNFDWNALSYLEEAFSGNDLPEENWEFKYILVKDESGKIILATFLTAGIFKDDLLSHPSVSEKIEALRRTDKYYLCSRMLVMGSLFTEGDHLYLDRNKAAWRRAVNLMVEEGFRIQHVLKCNTFMLRDFDVNDHEISNVFHDLGFFQLKMPNSFIIEGLQDKVGKDYLELLSAKGRRNVKQEVIKHFNSFEFKTYETLSEHQIRKLQLLYENVANRNLSVNLFNYPKKLFQVIGNAQNWEFHILENKEKEEQAIICCYKGNHSYFPIIIGVDYSHKEVSSYKQLLYRTVIFAREIGYQKLHLGITADTEKKKLGARLYSKVAYASVIDQFNMESIDKISYT